MSQLCGPEGASLPEPPSAGLPSLGGVTGSKGAGHVGPPGMGATVPVFRASLGGLHAATQAARQVAILLAIPLQPLVVSPAQPGVLVSVWGCSVEWELGLMPQLGGLALPFTVAQPAAGSGGTGQQTTREQQAGWLFCCPLP